MKKKTTFQIFKNKKVRCTLQMSGQAGTQYATSGFLLGESKDEYYLGDDLEEIAFTVKKDLVGIMEIVKSPKDKYDSMLDEYDIPQDSTGNN